MRSKYIAISQIPGHPGSVYYPFAPRTSSIPALKSHSLLIKISAAALNNRNLFRRKHLYPGTTFGTPILADGAGTVVAIGPHAQPG